MFEGHRTIAWPWVLCKAVDKVRKLCGRNSLASLIREDNPGFQKKGITEEKKEKMSWLHEQTFFWSSLVKI